MRSPCVLRLVAVGIAVLWTACRSEVSSPDVQGRIVALERATPSAKKGALLATLMLQPESGAKGPVPIAVTTETEVIGRGRYRIAFSVLEVGYDVQVWLKKGSPSESERLPVAERVVVMRSRL